MTKSTNLGKALLKSRFSKAKKTREPGGSISTERWLHTSELQSDETDWNKLNLKSVTEQNSLDEFLTTAELAGTDFESERLNLNFAKPKANVGILSKDELKFVKDLQEKNLDLLRIPRKPEWKGADYDAQTLQLKERESFLEWRKKLSLAQENLHLSMTPFEKNLEFWRQLWRVIERSDVVVQIVDARNPLLFYCKDLEDYVKEIDTNKLNLVLVNKSDFLTDRQRLTWLEYFESRGIRVVFWSAVLAASKVANSEINSELDELEDEHSEFDEETEDGVDEEAGEDDEEEGDDDETETLQASLVNKFTVLTAEDEEAAAAKSESDTETEEDGSETEEAESDGELEAESDENVDDEKVDKKPDQDGKTSEQKASKDAAKPAEKATTGATTQPALETKTESQLPHLSDEQRDKIKILSRDELIALFKSVHKHVVDKAKPGVTTIGLVGYPNVGKSSTINALFHNKKVAVSDTPGKTKHYQTLFVDDELVLCDCPGLVFPSFVSTRGELIINGILPIDQMRDYVEPINLMLHHIPRVVFEMIYGVEMPKPKDGQDAARVCTAEELCTVYALSRGYMNHKGMPDVNRGSRYLLKDYVNGKLLFCYPPPALSAEPQAFQEHRYEMSKELIYLERLRKLQKKIQEREKNPKQSNFDKDFFTNLAPKALTKGGIVGYHRNKNQVVQRGADIGGRSSNDLLEAPIGKPWKKHHNAHKREKLRRKTSHFDAYEF